MALLIGRHETIKSKKKINFIRCRVQTQLKLLVFTRINIIEIKIKIHLCFNLNDLNGVFFAHADANALRLMQMNLIRFGMECNIFKFRFLLNRAKNWNLYQFFH